MALYRGAQKHLALDQDLVNQTLMLYHKDLGWKNYRKHGTISFLRNIGQPNLIH